MDVIGVCGDAKYTSIRDQCPADAVHQLRQTRVGRHNVRVRPQAIR